MPSAWVPSRYARTADLVFAVVGTSITTLHARGEGLCVVPQNLYEFWAASTRPIAGNGLGLTVPECQDQVARTKQLFRFLPDLPTLYSEYEALLGTHACEGRMSCDARLVAAMHTHGITRLLTLTVADFSRFPGLDIHDPISLAASISTPPTTAS